MTSSTPAGLPDPTSLSATVSPAGGDDTMLELLAHAADSGHLVAGRTMTVAGQGAAAVLALPHGLEDRRALRDVVAWLQAVPCDDNLQGPHSRGPIAVGAFPFDRGAPAFLVVPSVACCSHADGSTWRVTVSGPETRAPGAACAPATRAHRPSVDDDASSSGVQERPTGAEYAAAVATALKEIGAGRLSKVVLSRALDVVCATAPRASALLGTLWGRDPVFSPFSLPVGRGRLIGASPELIVSRIGPTVTSHPFAGTIPLGALGGEDPAGRLFASLKDRNEHRLLVDELAAALRPWCSELDVPEAPSVVPLRSDARLGSLIRGTLRTVAPDGAPDAAPDAASTERLTGPSALDLLALLHPTPAVGGVPRPAALEAISLLEPEPRGYWAGVAGWVDAAGDGEWVLAIRSAILEGRRATLRAGAGIVEGSDPTAELAETTVKLAPVLDALCPGRPGPV